MLGIDEYQQRVSTAVMQAIFDTSLTEIDGEQTAYVNTREVMAAPINVMGALVESSPTCTTPKGIQETAEATGKKLHQRIREMRAIVNETGQRPFETLRIRPN